MCALIHKPMKIKTKNQVSMSKDWINLNKDVLSDLQLVQTFIPNYKGLVG
jgi:hypothetical protein